MSTFKYSIVLFSGEDGLPLEFNIVNTTEKELLKSMIEHGGGLCTLSDDAINLVSPGTKVFNVDFKRKFISSKFVFDCAENNCLMNMSDYEIKITVLETSDISNDSGNIVNPSDNIKYVPATKNIINSIEIRAKDEPSQTSWNKIVCSNVSSDDFQPSKLVLFSSTPTFPTCENSPKKVLKMDLITEEPSLEQAIEEYSSVPDTKKDVTDMEIDIDNPSSPNHCIEEYSSSIAKSSNVDKTKSQIEDHVNCPNLGENEISDRTPSDLQLEAEQINEPVKHMSENFSEKDECLIEKPDLDSQHSNILPNNFKRDSFERQTSEKKSPEVTVTAVSSSQSQNNVDEVDCMIFGKSQKVQLNEEAEYLSQSYTVSSSADAQVSKKAKDVSAEIFENNLSDCDEQDSQLTERQLYIQKLEKKVESILQKPSPKSIQDKLCLLKYICCVKRLPPAEVLQALKKI